jgi:hypothetical protein
MKAGAAGVLIRFAAGSSFSNMPHCGVLYGHRVCYASVSWKNYKISVSEHILSIRIDHAYQKLFRV